MAQREQKAMWGLPFLLQRLILGRKGLSKLELSGTEVQAGSGQVPECPESQVVQPASGGSSSGLERCFILAGRLPCWLLDVWDQAKP